MTNSSGNDFRHRPAAVADDRLNDEVLSGLVSRLTTDTLKYLPAVILPAVAGVFGVAFFTRIFPPGPFGEYSLVYVIVAVATSILSGWLQQSMLRYLPRYRSQGGLDEFLVKFGSIVWIFSLVAFGVLLLLGWPLRPLLGVYGRYYIAAVTWIVTGIVFLVQLAAFQAEFRSGAYSRYQVAYAVGRVVLPLVLIYWLSEDVIALVIGSAVAYAVLIVPMVIELGMFRGRGEVGLGLDVPLLKKIYSYGFPVVGTILGVKVLDLSDRFVIELFRETEEVGIYSANYSLIAMGVLFVASPILSAAVPLIMDAWETGHRERIQSVISSFSRYFLITSIPVVAYTLVFAREIVTVFLGEAFREGYTIVPYVLIGAFLWNFATYGHEGLKLLEKTRVMFVLVAICCAVNLTLNFIFVPRYGYNGAAVTTLVSYALYPVMVYWVSRRGIEWMIPWRSVARVTAAGAAGTLAWWGVKAALAGRIHVALVLAIALPVGTLAYLAALVVLRELHESELRLVGIRRRAR